MLKINNEDYIKCLLLVTPPRPISRTPSSEILSTQSEWTIVFDQPVSEFLLWIVQKLHNIMLLVSKTNHKQVYPGLWWHHADCNHQCSHIFRCYIPIFKCWPFSHIPYVLQFYYWSKLQHQVGWRYENIDLDATNAIRYSKCCIVTNYKHYEWNRYPSLKYRSEYHSEFLYIIGQLYVQ